MKGWHGVMAGLGAAVIGAASLAASPPVVAPGVPPAATAVPAPGVATPGAATPPAASVPSPAPAAPAAPSEGQDETEAPPPPKAPKAPAKPLARVLERRVERRSKNGRCSVSVLYPQLGGMADPKTEQKLNHYLEKQWLGPVRYALDNAIKSCTSLYQSSTGFQSVVSPGGILSLKRTLTVERGGSTPSLTQECYLVDLRRGGRYDVAHLLGKDGLAHLAELIQKSLATKGKSPLKSADLRLTDRNFTACSDGRVLQVQLGTSLLKDDRTIVEVGVPLTALDGLDALQGP